MARPDEIGAMVETLGEGRSPRHAHRESASLEGEGERGEGLSALADDTTPASRAIAAIDAIDGINTPVMLDSTGTPAPWAQQLPGQEITPAVDAHADLSRNSAAVYLAALAPGARRTMRQALDVMAELLGTPRTVDVTGRVITHLVCPWGQLRYAHTTAVRARLAERYAPSTANKMLAALRRVLQEAWRLGQMSAEEYARARDVPAVSGSVLPRGRALSHGELHALLQVCTADRRPAGGRDAALIAALYSTMMRRAEVVALALEDYAPAEGALRVRRGKGRKERLTYLEAGSAQALADWLTVRGPQPGPLFCPLTKSGRVVLRPMRPQAVAEILDRRAAEAAIAPCSPHDLRRTGISDLLDAGADIATVQQLAGHADPATTARYDRRGERAKRRSVHLLHVPYTRRAP